MTEEKKENKCAQCECCKKFVEGLKEFTFKALIIYVGVTLAIITSANLLKPKHHCPFARPYPGIQRPMPPAPMMYGHFNGMKKFRGDRPDFKGPKGDFRKFGKPAPGIPAAPQPEVRK